MKFKAGDYVIPNYEGADPYLIYKVLSTGYSSGTEARQIYNVTLSGNRYTREKCLTYINNNYRLLTKAEVLLYVRF